MIDFNKYLKRTPEEEAVVAKIDEISDKIKERTKELREEQDKLYKEWHELRKSISKEREKDIESAYTSEQVVHRIQARLNKNITYSNSVELEEAISAVRKLSKSDLRRLLSIIENNGRGLVNADKYDDLIHILVGVVTDYASTHGMTDLDAVYFSVDGLESSVREVVWGPGTDASLSAYRYLKDEDKGHYVRTLDGFIC